MISTPLGKIASRHGSCTHLILVLALAILFNALVEDSWVGAPSKHQTVSEATPNTSMSLIGMTMTLLTTLLPYALTGGTCMFFWLLDRVVHQLYVTVVYCTKGGIGPKTWEVYLKKDI